MFRAMAWKEFREISPVLFYGLLISGLPLLVPLHSSHRLHRAPFVDDPLIVLLCMCFAVVAFLVGVVQSLGESRGNMYLFLFHRPAARRWIIAMKLLVGATSILLCAAIPLSIYGLWAASPMTHASPFEWSMTVPAWTAMFALTPIYLAAFLIGVHPGGLGRFLLFPLLPILFVAAMKSIGFGGGLCVAALVAAVDLWLIAAIMFVARTRDYP